MLDLAKLTIGSAHRAGPRGRSLDHVLKSQQDLNTPYVDRRSTGGFNRAAPSPPTPCYGVYGVGVGKVLCVSGSACSCVVVKYV